MEEEDYTGCVITCTSWVQEDAFFDAHLVDKVAKGGWGQIYLAEIKSGPATGDFVAVKVITTGSAFTLSKVDELLYRIFNVEASCLVGMSGCPEVAQLIATSEVDKYGYTRYCLVLEWMACGDAQMLLTRLGRPLSYEAAGVLMVSVLRALHNAHSLGYMHRDVKASNILLGAEGQVQLADWGICGVLEEEEGVEPTTEPTSHQGTPDQATAGAGTAPAAESQQDFRAECHELPCEEEHARSSSQQGDTSSADSGSPSTADQVAGAESPREGASQLRPAGSGAVRGAPLGTPFWAAPELDAGDPHNESVDIWSFGITFVELITGRQPYYDTSPDGLRALMDPETGFVPADLPEEVTNWLHPCLSVDPAGRPSAEQLLKHPFFVRMAAALEEQQAAVAAAAAAVADGTADSAAVANCPPWLTFSHSTALGHGLGYSHNFSGDGSSNNSGWDGLPLVEPAGGWESLNTVAFSSRDHLATASTSDGTGDSLLAGDARLEPDAVALSSMSAPEVCEAQHNAMYPHLDPEVVEEMRRLQMVG